MAVLVLIKNPKKNKEGKVRTDRLIRTLNRMVKVFERLLIDRIDEVINRNIELSPNQFVSEKDSQW